MLGTNCKQRLARVGLSSQLLFKAREVRSVALLVWPWAEEQEVGLEGQVSWGNDLWLEHLKAGPFVLTRVCRLDTEWAEVGGPCQPSLGPEKAGRSLGCYVNPPQNKEHSGNRPTLPSC